MVPYSMVRNLITKAVMDATTTDDKIVVYVKEHENGCEICFWMKQNRKSMLKIRGTLR